ncbi:MAG: hypothetical protein JWQ72_3065, partial [Polaromonas sp.]|nr:hypothetical protein [Polaromonas sp.]
MTNLGHRTARWAHALPARATAVSRSPLWRRRLAWAVGSLLAIWLLAYALVPPLARAQIEKLASGKLGRAVTVGTVDFKPWSLELTLSDLAVARAQPATGAAGASAPARELGASPQLSIRRLYIDAELASLLRLAPVADAVQVDGLAVSLTHFGGGRYDIDDIMARLQPPAAAPAGEALRFALYNIVLGGAQVDFRDEAVGRTHELRDLNLSIPFLSNLDSQRDVKTAPRLAFRLNGSSFDTAAEGTPFAQTRKTDAALTLRNVDLRPYLGYLPAGLPFRLQRAVLNADLKLAFEQTPAAVVRLSGSVTADQVSLLQVAAKSQAPAEAPAGAVAGAAPELLSFDQLRVVMEDVRPLDQVVKLSRVELTGPALHIVRHRAGDLNILPAGTAVAESPAATKTIAGGARPEGAAGTNASPAPAAPRATAAAAWKVEVAAVAVRGGRVSWRDETLASPAEVRLAGLSLDAAGISLPFRAGAPARVSGALGLDLEPAAPATATGAAGSRP